MMRPRGASPGKSTRAGPRYLRRTQADSVTSLRCPCPTWVTRSTSSATQSTNSAATGSSLKPTARVCISVTIDSNRCIGNSIGAVLWCLCIPRHHRAPKRLHSVDPGRCWSSIFDLTRTVSHIVFTGTLLRYPDIEWVFTHGGGALPLLAERMELFRALLLGDDDPHHTVPRQLRRLWFDIAGTPFPHQVPAAVAAFGADRLLYGSDYCWTPPHGVDAQLASIEQADQPADDSWRALTTRNAIRLLAARETAQ